MNIIKYMIIIIIVIAKPASSLLATWGGWSRIKHTKTCNMVKYSTTPKFPITKN